MSTVPLPSMFAVMVVTMAMAAGDAQLLLQRNTGPW